MMEICLDAVDYQTAKLNEFVLVAHRIRKAGRRVRPGFSKFKLKSRNGGDARASSPTGRKNVLAANDFMVLASPELSEAPSAPISPQLRETTNAEGDIASSEQAISIPLQEQAKLQQKNGKTKALLPRSDDGPRGEPFQRSHSSVVPLHNVMSPLENKIESSGRWRTSQANLAKPQDRPRLQRTGKEKQASLPRSDGGPRGEFLQRSHPASVPLEVASRILESSIEGADSCHTHQVVSKGLSSLPCNSVFSSISASLGRSSETLETVVAKQTEREDLSAARAKVPRTRGAQRKNSISLVMTPSPHTLIVQPSNGSGAASPDGEASQGPLPVDYNLEIEADFPKELVLTMQENAAKKAR
jgi:hypothetical protein